MTQQELILSANVLCRVDEEHNEELKKDAQLFSEIDKKSQQEIEAVVADVEKQKARRDIKANLKARFGYKKVEWLGSDVAVVSDAHYKMGVVTLEGDVVVPFGKYGWIGPFGEDGTAPVRDGKRSSSRKDAKWGAVNKGGEEVRPLVYRAKRSSINKE